MKRQKQRIAWCLVAIFALGGIVAPLAHQGFHSLDAQASGDKASTDVVVELRADKFECELCEITLVGARFSEDSSAIHVQFDGPAELGDTLHLAQASLFQSRAPPIQR